jgi:hypothetical protein
LVLSCCAGPAACSTDRAAALPPLPEPVIAVPVLVRIPIDLTEPCETPPRRPLATDVDLLAAAEAFKVWGQCNANKLTAIRGLSDAAATANPDSTPTDSEP